MGKSSAPPPPDPKATAAASTSTNIGTAVANAFMNNMGQNTPDGSLAYEQSGTYQWKDPYTGQTYDIPMFTANQTLSPGQQAIYDQNQGAQLNLATLANNQSGFLNDYMAQPFQYNPGQHESWAMGLYDQLNNPVVSQGEERLRGRLANQGIKAGSEAYDRELQNYYDSTGNQRNKFLLDSYNTGFGTAQAQRNQPINEITALLSGSQVSQPNFVNTPQSTIPTTDVAGIINQNYQNQMQNWQANQNQSNGLIGGLFGMGANLLALSDKRAKTDIEKVGKLDEHTLYRYRYKGEGKGAPKHVGVMAQEAKKTRPDAVVTGSDGLHRVDYGALFGVG